MKRASPGYTLIEVMIVLAISSVMFVSAVTIFQGKQSETRFNQAMFDLESKIKLVVNDVNRSVFPADRYTCDTNTASGVNRPYLTLVSSRPAGTSQDCIFLGKAIEARAGQEVIRIYNVLGNRTYQSGGNSLPVTSFDDARPEPAVYFDQTLINELIEEHPIRSGDAEIVWACSEAVGSCPPALNRQRDMAGFYNSLQTTTDPKLYGSQSLFTQTYRLPGSANDVRTCIEQTSCDITEGDQNWKICMTSGNGKNTAILTVTSSSSGVTTQLQIKPDPAVCPGP